MARGALAAEVVGDAFAVRGLREHSSESEFADAARSGEKQRVRNAFCAKGTPQRRDNSFVA